MSMRSHERVIAEHSHTKCNAPAGMHNLPSSPDDDEEEEAKEEKEEKEEDDKIALLLSEFRRTCDEWADRVLLTVNSMSCQ